MLNVLRARLSYANVMSTIAVFAALGGGAYAAVKLPAGSVGRAQLKANAVTSAKVEERDDHRERPGTRRESRQRGARTEGRRWTAGTAGTAGRQG